MNILDLIAEFKITYELGSLGLPGFENDEIKKLLQINVYKAISQKLGGNNVYNTKFPATNKRIDDLQGLIVTDDTNVGMTMTQGPMNTKLITLPNDFLHIYKLMVTYDDAIVEEAIQISMESIPRVAETRLNTGIYLQNPVYIFTNGPTAEREISLYYDSTQVLATAITLVQGIYIKIPEDLETVADGFVLTNFNEDVYHEIVAMTVDNAIDIASPQKSPISKQQLNKAE